MKAVVYTRYGPPEVLHLAEVARPVPADGELLVRIRAAAANPLDWHYLRAKPFFMRFFTGMFKPREQILGADIAGEVVTNGPGAGRFTAGEAVMGLCDRGGYAEFACVPEAALVRKPDNISFESAAGIPVAGLTALQCLRDQGDVVNAASVLVNGASGGVGSYAVQLAKYFGAEVTAVCSTSNIELVQALGADFAVDYRHEDFCRGDRHYDLILDNVGNRSLDEVRRVLSADGTYLLNAYAPALMLKLAVRGAIPGKKRQTLRSTEIARADREDLEFLAELAASDKMTTAIDRVYPLDKTGDAIKYLERGHARGKVIVSVNHREATAGSA